jgi:uncharacterized membrane protein HdeD (DUF308 family)
VFFVEGLVGIAAGVLTLIWPGLTAIALLYLIAAWAIVTVALEIAAAIRLRKVIANEWLLGLSGIASLGFGIVLILFPGAGALTVVIWIGAYALVFGALVVALAFRLRSLGGRTRPDLHMASLEPEVIITEPSPTAAADCTRRTS